MLSKWSHPRVPYRRYDDMELELSRTMKKSPFMIRFYTERMIMELEMGRQLTPEEQQHLSGKVKTSGPRNMGA